MIETKPITMDRFAEGLQIYIHHRDNKTGQYRERKGMEGIHSRYSDTHTALFNFDGDNPVQKCHHQMHCSEQLTPSRQ